LELLKGLSSLKILTRPNYMVLQKVSIGIPTYNRPESLRRTLECITNQTYSNIEIIVSDNCSPDERVQEIISEFEKNDSRIINIRQAFNVGAINNFKFVLSVAKGNYFMWAADDDEWEPEYVEHLLSIIGTYSAAFCNYSVRYQGTQSEHEMIISKAAQGDNIYEQARNFLLERVPSMFYSIYVIENIRWFQKFNKTFDWFDCYFIFRVILLGNGYVISKKNLYKAGIQGETYEYKPINRNKTKVFTYSPYISECLKVIWKAKMDVSKKIKLVFYLLDVNFRSFIEIEKVRKKYNFYFIFFKFYTLIIPKIVYKRLY